MTGVPRRLGGDEPAFGLITTWFALTSCPAGEVDNIEGVYHDANFRSSLSPFRISNPATVAYS